MDPTTTTPEPAISSTGAPARMPLRQPPYEPELERYLNNAAFGGLTPKNLRLVLAHQPQLAAAFQALAHELLFKSALPEREREIAIIRTGALTRSEYEWGMHVSIYGESCGLSREQIAQLTQGTPDEALWTPRERLVVQVVDELHHHSTVSDTTWAALQAHWPPAQILELILATSFYHMAAFVLNSMAVPLEHGAERFPPGLEQARVPA